MAKSLWKGGKEYLIYGRDEAVSGAAPMTFSDRHAALAFLRGLPPGNARRATLCEFQGEGDLSQASDQQLFDRLATRLVNGEVKVMEKAGWKPVKRKAYQKASGAAPRPRPAPEKKAPLPPVETVPTPRVTNKGPDDKPKLLTIEFLDGDGDAVLKQNGLQFVNLPARKALVGSPAKTIDRLGRVLSFKATFDKPGSVSFTVKLVAGGGNVKYSADEKKRNKKFVFKVKARKGKYSSKGKISRVYKAQIFVAVAGNDSYWLEAEDQWGNRASSKRVYTQRVVYYVDLKMAGVSASGHNDLVEREFRNYGIRLVHLGSQTMEAMKNVDPDSKKDEVAFLKKAKKVYFDHRDSKREPHVMVLAWVGDCAVQTKNVPIEKVLPASQELPAMIKLPVVLNGERKLLWNKIASDNDKWLVSAIFETRVKRRRKRINIKSKCTPFGAFVKVDLTGLPTTGGTIKIKVNAVDLYAGGLAFLGYNMICVATRSRFRSISGRQQTNALIHELGHQFGMVPSGKGSSPAKGAYY